MMRAYAMLLAVLLAWPALADGMGPAPKPPKADHTPATFFASEKTCKAASDGCRICMRTNAGFSCSTPGIACVPKDWVCTD